MVILKKHKYPLDDHGFTLIELLVVIAIFGILMSVIIANLSQSKSKSRDNKRVSDLQALQLGLELYYDKNRGYPTTLDGLVTPSKEFVHEIPAPPLGGAYIYATTGSGASCSGYHLGAVMENDSRLLSDDADQTVRTICTGSAPDFHGNATNCSGGTPAGTDLCYDVKERRY
ncbi:MAG: hypothetical protein A2928_02555 [Candidatus Taylorbacteria bacterium RIFCSPLOWO2_01_FULL_45_15b]|uniref:Type II secretion system protein GspG C-terminal domain-containing protein n=1 Tax=Candidatus Taylorbacteria bacterium RIFCSPLOWO2_01_FULL_45_15b TaxID=1802319 RepID=A0A1G2NEA8_9BACT|nr:MAG: hypothetical protein A2928_02555 [Candidatus Taylorbacteria bacterium RIFCSPLOWO2_01_FULL_45_15b]